MPKKRLGRDPSIFHADAKHKSIIVRPKIEPQEPEESDSVLWREVAPDLFAPDKPDKETRQIMAYRDTHQSKSSKRPKGKRN